MATNIYLNEQWKAEQAARVAQAVTPQVNQAAAVDQVHGRFGKLEFVPGSADKVVTPEVDRQVVVTPQTDNRQHQVVRRI